MIDSPVGDTTDISVEKVVVNDETFQARTGYDSTRLENLADDMEQFGQRAPIGVRPHPERVGEYQLIYGFHRTKAARQLGWDTIHATVYDEIDDSDALELSIRDNSMHQDLTKVEKATQAAKLKREGWSVDELCEAFNTNKSAIYNWLKVADLEDKYLALIDEGYLSLYHGVELAKLECDSKRLEIALLALRHGFSVRKVREWVEYKRGNDGELSPVIYLGRVEVDQSQLEAGDPGEGIQEFLNDTYGGTGLPDNLYGRWDLHEEEYEQEEVSHQ